MSKKIGLALGCGGARGLAHLGVLKVLDREGIKPDFIVGSSMGAFIGALYALGFDLGELEKEALSFNRQKAARKLLDFANPRRSLMKGKKIKKYFNQYLEGKNFGDTKIPLYITATNLNNGEQVVLHRGGILEAVLASISVPGVFPPVKWGDEYLVDGGVCNPTPVDVVKELGADVVIGVDLIMKRTVKLDNPTLFNTLVQSYEIIRMHGAKHKVEHMEKDAIIIAPKLRGAVDSFKFYNIDKFIESGEKATKEVLPKIKRAIK